MLSNVRGGVPLQAFCGETRGHFPGHGPSSFPLCTASCPCPALPAPRMTRKSESPFWGGVTPAVGGLDPIFVCWGCRNKVPDTGGGAQKGSFSPRPGGCKASSKVSSGSASPWPVDSVLLPMSSRDCPLCVHPHPLH